MAVYDNNILLDSEITYQQYQPPVITQTDITNITGDVTIITTINGGGGGQATGPTITLGSNWSGVNFIASGSNLNIEITNAANARAALSAAKSGVNSDLTQFTALTGSGGWAIWTGTPDKASHATYSGTASVGYVQAELQGVMDKLQQITEAFKALQDTLLAGGEIKP